jgi:hypothetical protein
MESLAVSQRLALADPTNAGWQRDLWVSYWRMAVMSERLNHGDAMTWCRKAYDQLSGMKKKGVYISPQDEGFLRQLREKLSAG